MKPGMAGNAIASPQFHWAGEPTWVNARISALVEHLLAIPDDLERGISLECDF